MYQIFLQYFVHLIPLFFKLQKKQPSIQIRGHWVSPTEATLIPCWRQFLSFEENNSRGPRGLFFPLQLLGSIR